MDEKQEDIVYWTLLNSDTWEIYIAATKDGLCYIGSQAAPFEELSTWVNKHLPHHKLVEDKEKMAPYETELIDYLQGKRCEFNMPMDFHGTEFQKTVWKTLEKVPFGKIVTYTDIAKQMNRPDAVRAVGTAIGANPMLITIPCHRLIGKSGEERGYRGGLDMKKRLLELEK